MKRSLGIITATAIVVANMIGTGIFTTTGIMASHVPSPVWILVCWVLGGMIALGGALCYSELATRMPVVGGEYVYLKTLFHPALGFLTGWTSFFVGFSAPIALAAFGFSEYLFKGFPNILNDTQYPAILVKKLLAIGIIMLFTAIHYTGYRLGAAVQNGLTAVKIVSILGLAVAGSMVGAGSFAHITAPAQEPFNLIGFGTAMIMVMFAFSGWNASTYIAGELRNPRKTLPFSLSIGTIIVIALYLVINVFIFYAAPFREITGSITVVEVASVNAFGPWAARLVSAIISMALLSSLSAYLIIGPRVYQAMALDRMFFPFAARVHPRFDVPSRSVLLQGVVAMAMVLIGSFEQILIYVGFSLGIFPWLAVAGLFIARKRKIGEATAVKTWGFPYVPIFFLSAGLLMMIATFIRKPWESLVAIGTITLGIPFYYLWVKKMK
jgi:APA family basic amino acid/polyamine antiporter